MKRLSGCVATLLALCAASCAELEVPEGAAGGGADEVAVVSQELGSWSKRYVKQTDAAYTSLTSGVFMATGESAGSLCKRDVEVVFMPDATRIAAPPIPDSPGCEWITASYGTRAYLFAGDSQLGKIWRLRHDEGGTFWILIANTPGTPIHRIRHDSTHVYWSDNRGVHKAPVGGGAVTTLAGGGHKLLDRDGTDLYVQRTNSDNYTLLRLPTAGGAMTSLRTMSYEFNGFAFNSTHIYFGQLKWFDWDRIYKMAKTPGGVSVFAEMDYDDGLMGDIAANETHVYWLQNFSDDRGNRLQRRRISDASDSSIHCKGDVWCADLMLTPDNVFLLGRDPDETAVWRGQL